MKKIYILEKLLLRNCNNNTKMKKREEKNIAKGRKIKKKKTNKYRLEDTVLKNMIVKKVLLFL